MVRSPTLRAPLWLLLLGLMPRAAGAAELPRAVESTLVADIQQAQRQLTASETRIAGEASALADEINARHTDLLGLRADAAVARRLADEQTLGLDALEQRIERWRNQERYQQGLLTTFAAQRHGAVAPPGPVEDMAGGRALVDEALAEIERALAPRFERKEAALTDGRVVELDTLSLGPLRWYWYEDAGGALSTPSPAGGPQLREDAPPHAVMAFGGTRQDGLRQLRETGAASVALDPSIYRIARAHATETPWQHVARGGVWMVPILAFAILATAIGIGKFVQFARLPRIRPLGAAVGGGSVPPANLERLAAGMGGPQRELIRIVLEHANAERRDDALLNYLLDHRQRLERFLGALAVTATVSPLLGLLGTVSGMISTFSLMTLFGAGDPSAVSGGISEALVTTETGLVVAIPALVMHALLSRRATIYQQRLEACAVEFSKLGTGRG